MNDEINCVNDRIKRATHEMNTSQYNKAIISLENAIRSLKVLHEDKIREANTQELDELLRLVELDYYRRQRGCNHDC